MGVRHIHVVVDGGGSSTRSGLVVDGETIRSKEGESCSPHAVGRRRAADNLGQLLNALWDSRPSEVKSVDLLCLALGAASTPAQLQMFISDLLPLSRACVPLQARKRWLMNDILPIVADSESCEPRVAAICGTGTGFAARGPTGQWSRASGYEYLLSDEGGGFDIGLGGLRAVVRAADGRGNPTALSSLLLSRVKDLTQLYDAVYEKAQSKSYIASFAPMVIEAALDGDDTASAILGKAARELALGILAAARSVRIPTGSTLALAGSLLASASSPMSELVMRQLSTLGGGLRAEVINDNLGPIMRLALRLDSQPEFIAGADSCIPVARF